MSVRPSFSHFLKLLRVSALSVFRNGGRGFLASAGEIRLLKIERAILRGAALIVYSVSLKDQFNAGAELLRVDRAVPGYGRFFKAGSVRLRNA
jgi:hypothetical protein